MSKKFNLNHCSECIHYLYIMNNQMWCYYLKRRITARKQPCKAFSYGRPRQVQTGDSGLLPNH